MIRASRFKKNGTLIKKITVSLSSFRNKDQVFEQEMVSGREMLKTEVMERNIIAPAEGVIYK